MDTTIGHPEIVKEYYGRPAVQYEISKALKNREMVFINVAGDTVVRDLSGWKVEYLNMCIDAYRLYENGHRIYKSVAQMDVTPMASFNPVQRKEDKERGKEMWAQSTRYDFVLDLDCASIGAAKRRAVKVLDLYNEYKVCFTINFSGNKGFHIAVANEYLPDIPEKNKLCEQLAKSITALLNIKDIDIMIYDRRRVIKAPYSVDIKSGKPLVVLPLTDEQLLEFKKEDVTVERIMDPHEIRLFNRGLLERKGDPNGFKNLMKDLHYGPTT